MSTAGAPEGWELVVGPDGSIPAEQLARLGLRPGAHLRVVVEQPARSHRSAYGVLAGEPAPSWADYETASRLAIAGSDRSNAIDHVFRALQTLDEDIEFDLDTDDARPERRKLRKANAGQSTEATPVCEKSAPLNSSGVRVSVASA